VGEEFLGFLLYLISGKNYCNPLIINIIFYKNSGFADGIVFLAVFCCIFVRKITTKYEKE